MTITDTIEITQIGAEAVTIMLRGSLDLATATEVNDHLAPLLETGIHLRLDFSETTFIDTEGAKAFIAAARQAHARGDTIEVTAWSPAAERLRDALAQITI